MATAAPTSAAASAGSSSATSDALFTVTTQFREAIKLMNGVSAKRFPLLLERIVTNLHNSESDRIFTEEEEKQLQTLLSLTAASLNTVLEACAYVFEQTAYRGTSATVLAKELAAAGLAAKQAAAFEAVWASKGGALVSKIRATPFGAPFLLHSAKWEMHLKLGQSGLGRARDASALFEMELTHAGATKDSEAERFNIEFSHDELFSFFQNIEKIQQQLDRLS